MATIWRVGSSKDGYSFVLVIATGRREAIENWREKYEEIRPALEDARLPLYKEIREGDPDIVENRGETVVMDDEGWKIS